METFLTTWLYIIIAAIICVAIWCIFAGKSNDWGNIPFFIRLPLLVVSVFLAFVAQLLIFAWVKIVPSILNAVIMWTLYIISFFAGWDVEAWQGKLVFAFDIIGDILVSPYVLGCVCVVGLFPDFPRDRVRNFVYKLLATIEISGLMIYVFFNTRGQISKLDSIIFTIEVVVCAIYILRRIYKDYTHNT